MKWRSRHRTEAELLGFAEAELPRRRARRVRLHLDVCPGCRSRLRALSATLETFAAAHRDAILLGTPPPVARARGLARWREQPTAARPPRVRRFAAALAAAAVVALALVATLRHAPPGAARAQALPNARLTPGAVRRDVRLRAVCRQPPGETNAAVASAVRARVFREYGIGRPRAASYEVDYLITPGLGGRDSLRNLWPEPRRNTRWNAYVKDELERYLQQSVCQGSLSLAAAQRELSRNWIAAYQRSFHSDQPLSPAAAAVILRQAQARPAPRRPPAP